MLKLFSKLPLSVLYFLATIFYLFVFYVLRYRRKVVKGNIVRAFPKAGADEINSIAKNFYRNFADVVAEVIYARTMSPEELTSRVKITNMELVTERLEDGQSIMLLSGHHSNWEWLLLSAGMRIPIPMNVVYKPLHSSPADRFMQETRGRFGVQPIDLNDYAKEVVKNRREQHVYCVLPDQRPQATAKAYKTEFLNTPTRFIIGPEKIARLVNMPVMFACMCRLSRGHYQVTVELVSEPPYEKNDESYRVTEDFVRILEATIREQPESWLWANRRWKPPKKHLHDALGIESPPP